MKKIFPAFLLGTCIWLSSESGMAAPVPSGPATPKAVGSPAPNTKPDEPDTKAEHQLFMDLAKLLQEGKDKEARALVRKKSALAGELHWDLQFSIANRNTKDPEIIKAWQQIIDLIGTELGLGQDRVNPVLEVFSSQALRKGNLAVALRIQRDLEARRPANQAVPENLSLFEARVALYGGRPSRALELAQPLLNNSKLAKFDVLDIAIEATYRLGQLERCRQLVAQLPAAVALVDPKHRGLAQFVAQTWEYRLQLERQPLGPQNTKSFLAQFQKGLQTLKTYHAVGSTDCHGRRFSRAYTFWNTQALRLQSEVDGQNRLALQKPREELSSIAQRFNEEATDSEPINLEYLTAILDAANETIEVLVELGDHEQASDILKTIEPVYRSFYEVLSTAEDQERKEHQAQVAWIEAHSPSDADRYPMKDWFSSALEGDFTRSYCRFHRNQIRVLLAQMPKDQSQSPSLQSHFEQAYRFQQMADKGLGWSGLDDIDWLKAEYLLTRKPSGWPEQLQVLWHRQLKLSNDFDYPAGKLACAALEAHLLAQQQHPAAALGLLSKILADPTQSRPLSRLHSLMDLCFSLQAKLQVQSGQVDKAFETLNRSQQQKLISNSQVFLANPQMQQLHLLQKQADTLENESRFNRQNQRDNSSTVSLLAKNKSEFHAALTRIRQQNPRYESMLAIRPVNFSRQQKFIPANAAIIQYFPADDSLYIFVATQTDLYIRQVAISANKLQQTLNRFQKEGLQGTIKELQNGSLKPEPSAALQAGLIQLHKILVDPIEQDVADKQVLAFIPTGNLCYVPFSALAKPGAKRPQYLIERKQCATLLKSADLDLLSQTTRKGGASVVSLGDPDGSLPAAGIEAQSVANLFEKSNARVFLGPQATRDKLASINSDIGYLHLATHGILNSKDPNQSYLVLANQTRLTLADIYELKLDGLRLVTLSACETALAENNPGSELTSLAEAFSVAGSNSVVASLWPVADRATGQLMQNFYREIREGASLAGALQKAEVSLLNDPKTAHPFYWAPFTLMGDWR